MIKRLGKAKKRKQGAILIMVVVILALAMIFISSAMLLTKATRNRLYENSLSSQARLTVTSAAEVFLEALETQEITDKQMDGFLSESPTKADGEMKMIIDGVPGMSEEEDNCTKLKIYLDEHDHDIVYCDFTTTIGDQVSNVRIELHIDDSQPSSSGRFKNQIDIAGDVGAEQLRFTEGVGMTSPAKRAQGITDNTILLRGSGYEQASSNVVYSTIVYAPGSVAKWGGGNTFHGDMVFLDSAYMSTYSSGCSYNGDFYFIGKTNNDVAFKFEYDAGWGDCFGANVNFYFDGRTVQDADLDVNQDQNHKIQDTITATGRKCYFVGVTGNVEATYGGKEYWPVEKDVSISYNVTNAGSSLPSAANSNMQVYKQYDYASAANAFPTDTTTQVLNKVNYQGEKMTLSTAQTFAYDNYGTDTNGTYYPAGDEIPAGTEIIKFPLTATYPEYLKINQGGSKVIDPNRTFNVGSLSSYDDDGDRIIDLNKGGAYYFTAGTTMSTNNDVTPYVFAVDGKKGTTLLYFGAGTYNLNCCVFALYNVSDTSSIICILEDGAKLVLSGDSQYQTPNSLCSAGFISLDRGKKSATAIGEYIQDKSRGYENIEWEQANGTKSSYSSYYDGNVRPNIYIYGVKNNTVTFGNDNIVEAYVGLYDGANDNSGFYSASNGAQCAIYGRLEGRRITNGTADVYLMPYCPAPSESNELPDERPAKTKYKVANITYYYGTGVSEGG